MSTAVVPRESRPQAYPSVHGRKIFSVSKRSRDVVWRKSARAGAISEVDPSDKVRHLYGSCVAIVVVVVVVVVLVVAVVYVVVVVGIVCRI